MHLDGVQPAPHILADKTLSQAIMNILNNAADASLAEVTLSASWDNTQLVLDIIDQGEGVNEDIKNQIGAPFFTTKASGEGTGLGLSLSFDIITKGHGGSLEVVSKEGEGTQFLITLPIV